MLDSPAATAPRDPTGPPSRDRRSTTGPSRRAIALLIVGSAVLVALIVLSVAAREADDAERATSGGWHGTLLEPARDRPDFTLTDTDGQPFDFADRTAGQLTFLYFGYTNCPDICPVHLNTLTQALRADPDIEATVVFVTTDPERDTPERLRSWLDQLSPAYVGLRGTPEEIDAAAVAAGVVPPAAERPGEDGFYLVAHATEIQAVTPDDQVHLLFPFGVVQSDWEADLARVVDDPTWMAPETEPAP